MHLCRDISIGFVVVDRVSVATRRDRRPGDASRLRRLLQYFASTGKVSPMHLPFSAGNLSGMVIKHSFTGAAGLSQ